LNSLSQGTTSGGSAQAHCFQYLAFLRIDEKFFSKIVKNRGANRVKLVLSIISLSHQAAGQRRDRLVQES
jgi:hypothetical protein